MSRLGKVVFVLIACFGWGCPNTPDPEEYARNQAREADKEFLGKSVKVETTLPSGVHVACDGLLDAAQLTEMLEEKEPLGIVDLTDKNPDSTSTCSIRRGGKALDEKVQDRQIEKTGRLGVMGGDELCNLTMYCSVTPDQSALEQRCKSQGSVGNHTLGVFSCVRVTPKGEKDGYSYRFIDADSKCTLEVRGGPGVVEEGMVQACSRAAMELITPASVRP
ncbi:hypothetical protein [Haliangium sp.]|uniref:hypothetical protein n=1 Tax=Haliangium sp. TaxID=2663208 RepID=UPI003D0D68E3